MQLKAHNSSAHLAGQHLKAQANNHGGQAHNNAHATFGKHKKAEAHVANNHGGKFSAHA